MASIADHVRGEHPRGHPICGAVLHSMCSMHLHLSSDCMDGAADASLMCSSRSHSMWVGSSPACTLQAAGAVAGPSRQVNKLPSTWRGPKSAPSQCRKARGSDGGATLPQCCYPPIHMGHGCSNSPAHGPPGWEEAAGIHQMVPQPQHHALNTGGGVRD